MKLILILLFAVVSCNYKKSTSTKDFEANRNDSVNFIDSLKWLYYAVNSNCVVVFKDTLGNTHEMAPFECEVQIDNISRHRSDSARYYFSFVKQHLKIKNLNPPGSDGFIVAEGKITPFLLNVQFQENENETMRALAKCDSTLRINLENYNGKISHWLKETAKKKGVRI
jgi:hypothetical protein